MKYGRLEQGFLLDALYVLTDDAGLVGAIRRRSLLLRVVRYVELEFAGLCIGGAGGLDGQEDFVRVVDREHLGLLQLGVLVGITSERLRGDEGGLGVRQFVRSNGQQRPCLGADGILNLVGANCVVEEDELRVARWLNCRCLSILLGYNNITAAVRFLWACLVLHLAQRAGFVRAKVHAIAAFVIRTTGASLELRVSRAEVVLFVNAVGLALGAGRHTREYLIQLPPFFSAPSVLNLKTFEIHIVVTLLMKTG